MDIHQINNQNYSQKDFEQIISSGVKVEIGPKAKEAVVLCYTYLADKLKNETQVIYGINTGFGSLCNTVIGHDDLEELQLNLVRSHACGLGDVVSLNLVKRILLLKAIGLCKGHSGVQLDTIERILFFYNADILPVIYEQGSLGASGDLAPLAHMSLPIIGEGEVFYKGNRRIASEILAQYNLEPIKLQYYICSRSRPPVNFQNH